MESPYINERSYFWYHIEHACDGVKANRQVKGHDLRIQQVTLDKQRESTQIYRGGDNVMTQGCYYSITCNDTGTLLQYYIYTLWSKPGPSHQCTIITLSLIESFQSMQACH